MDLNTIFDGWGTELVVLIVTVLLGIGGSAIWHISINRKKEVNKYNNTGDNSEQNIAKNIIRDDHSGNSNYTFNGTVIFTDTNIGNHVINDSLNNSTPQDKHVSLKDYLKDKLSDNNNNNRGVDSQQAGENELEKSLGEYLDANIIKGLKEDEKQILCLLYSNSQMNNRELCRNLSLSSKTIADKLTKLRDLGIISWIGNKSHGYWQVNIKS